jgi:nucleotide-binding universal stress UspA family protein
MEPARPIQRILVATDFSPCADAAAAVAAQLARQLGAGLEAVTFVDTSWITGASGEPAWHRQRVDEERQKAHRRMQAFADRLFAGLDDLHLHVFDGGLDPPNPSVAVLSVAETLKCDLIVLGTHGRTGLEHLVIGSVAEKVVRTSALPVLTVRG